MKSNGDPDEMGHSRFPVLIHCAETIKGGIATYLANLLPLQRVAYGDERIVLIMPDDQKNQLSSEVVGGVCVRYFPAPRIRLLRLAYLAVALSRAMSDHPMAVLHAHSTFAGAASRVVSRLRGFKGAIVYCAHGWAFDREGSAWLNQGYRLVERLLADWCERVICISQHDYQVGLAAGISPARMTVVFNALADPGPEPMVVPLPWAVGRKRLLFVGRFDRQKGVDVLVTAMRHLELDADCIVVGAGVWSDAIPEDWPANMHRLGWRTPSEIAYLLHACDALVVPSRWEGFGLVALEAMRASKPVLASAVGGLQEIVVSGESGVLFQVGNAAELAAIVRGHSVEQLRDLGRRGRQRFENDYQIEMLHSKLHGIYFESITKNSRSNRKHTFS